MLLHTMVPTPIESAHSVLNRTLGVHASEIINTMQHVLALRHSCHLEKYTVTLCAMAPVVCPPWGLMVIRDNSLGLLPTRNPHGFVAVR